MERAAFPHWGHDFRPEYRQPGPAQRAFRHPDRSIHGNATPRVQKEIVTNLKLIRPLVRVHGFYRPNLSFTAVMEGSERAAPTASSTRPTRRAGNRLVLFQKVEDLTAELRRAGMTGVCLSRRVHRGRAREKPLHFRDDSRVVLSWSRPMLSAWASTGPTCAPCCTHRCRARSKPIIRKRAAPGRDGGPARCLLLHGPRDVAIHEFFIRESLKLVPPDKQAALEEHKNRQLDMMRRYAYASLCRQRAIMDYFGDAEKLAQGCGVCDTCAPASLSQFVSVVVDEKTQECVRILLSGAARLQGRFGATQIIDLVAGSDTAQIRRHGHHALPTYGRLKTMSKKRLQALLQAVVRQNYLAQEGLRYPRGGTGLTPSHARRGSRTRQSC